MASCSCVCSVCTCIFQSIYGTVHLCMHMHACMCPSICVCIAYAFLVCASAHVHIIHLTLGMCPAGPRASGTPTSASSLPFSLFPCLSLTKRHSVLVPPISPQFPFSEDLYVNICTLLDSVLQVRLAWLGNWNRFSREVVTA